MDQRVTTTQPTLALGTDPNVSVARSARTVLDLPSAGEAETFFDSFVSLHLIGHKTPAILSKFRTRDSIDRRPDPEGDKSEFRQSLRKKRLSVCFLPGNLPSPAKTVSKTQSRTRKPNGPPGRSLPAPWVRHGRRLRSADQCPLRQPAPAAAFSAKVSIERRLEECLKTVTPLAKQARHGEQANG